MSKKQTVEVQARKVYRGRDPYARDLLAFLQTVPLHAKVTMTGPGFYSSDTTVTATWEETR